MYLGFDTSNYTTSVAAFDGENVIQFKKLLKVKKGEKGLRQSDAVFQHTVNMPELVNKIKPFVDTIDGIGVSSRPRNVDGSYMPCFLVGLNTANVICAFSKAPLHKISHQTNHILAALYSVKRLNLINERFIAFHISGGTTEALLVAPDKEKLIKAEFIAHSTDLKAGQAVDRAGVMLGLDFPCGAALDSLSLKSETNFKIHPAMNGCNCSLSGVENMALKMKADGASPPDIAKFVISYISLSIEKMTERIIEKYGDLPLVYAGGVMSNTIIKNNIKNRFNAYFAESVFSCDNAAGDAIYAYLKDRNDSTYSITG